MAKPWFIMKGETRVGPFTYHGLVSLASSGQLAADDPVWCADLASPIPAVCIAGLFPETDEPEPRNAPVEPAARVAPAPAPAEDVSPAEPDMPVSLPSSFPASPQRRSAFQFPPPPGLPEAFPSPPDDESLESLDDEDHDEPTDDGPYGDPYDRDADDDAEDIIAIPLGGSRSTYRQTAAPRRRQDNSNVLFVIGGLAFLVLVALVALVMRDRSTPSRPSPTARSPRTETAAPSPTQPTAAPGNTPAQPPPPPRPPRFDGGPLIDEMAKATVKTILDTVPSAQPRYREFWESQLRTELVQATRRMREEREIRATVTSVCNAWSEKTRTFLGGDSEPDPAPEGDSQAPDQPENSEGMEPGDGEAMPTADADAMEAE